MDYSACRTTIYEAWTAARHPEECTTEQLANLADAMLTTDIGIWNAVGTIGWIMAESGESWDESRVSGIGEGLAMFADLAKGANDTLGQLTSELARRRGSAK